MCECTECPNPHTPPISLMPSTSQETVRCERAIAFIFLPKWLCRLLRSNLSLHLPPRRKNHLVPPLLQQRLPLVPVRAPPLGRLLLLLLRDGGGGVRFRLPLLLLRRNLVLELVSRNQVRLRGLLGRLGRCRGAGRCVVRSRRGRGLEGDWGLFDVTYQGQQTRNALHQEKVIQVSWGITAPSYSVVAGARVLGTLSFRLK